MVNVAEISEHMEVTGSDGQHVGTVDHLVIKLTKTDPSAHGEHHILSLDAVESISEGKLVLSKPAAEAKQDLKHIAS